MIAAELNRNCECFSQVAPEFDVQLTPHPYPHFTLKVCTIYPAPLLCTAA
jgi:hypothetical protein